ncbi:pantoate--beta-alanine ligase [Acidithiobacillus sp. CV18-2]|uniref:Pantothenate synthetase n=1 Tax=Igneacidithiobacillus copahuensis TaxID=2724909 RepID=A0AAE3CJ68_9PROT|nr:pantoate--beta-alanine ligase [Igneacidithiobacillus copahuensis]MBU2754922.1 pantoate--beta-alanine ligase [Acidithiobacillus sp. CV18-3]MBU2758452.1 pantoate--beta-alanine ligase [Acidithiobacillus sp. BN09-2]MBU2778408.1 pantoate--beta-alanine ligase [Acidithiobacillus sp. CV18-2]MBU2797495.1 pantoate--beta-alanine ligase [Acidithiobacillus sp. VAN18-2]MBU2798248.1 pantoate--beta-alanine ligase [Acidithiobacillus sp. VAN18-4]UTV81836.1 pantoate--beta-alanine ligase [Acidithiobacillus sp
MPILRNPDSLRNWRQQQRGSLALVPTMGHLHAGHLALLRLAQARAEQVLVSIYVNPLQFGPEEDFASYPRTLESDLQQLAEHGCTTVFVPSDDDLYPRGAAEQTQVVPPERLSSILCGTQRPGHFTGVATIVLKLLHLAQPDILVLGEKDYQQYRIVGQMLDDLNLPVQLLCGPTQRDGDGLARSSRNSRLTSEQRILAPRLATELRQLCQLPVGSLVQAPARDARERLQAAGFAVDYLELRNSESLEPVSEIRPGARWLAAARLGDVRLIDNMVIP